VCICNRMHWTVIQDMGKDTSDRRKILETVVANKVRELL
jgi:hypothetical protein